MKKALPLILIAGAVVAFMMYRKSQQPSAEPLQIGPGPQVPTGAEKAAEEIKKVAKKAKGIVSKIQSIRAKLKARKSGKIGFDDSSVLV